MSVLVSKMVKTHRFEYVAKMASDLVFDVLEKCLRWGKPFCLNSLNKVDVTGFSFGE